jgi:capsular polysaccharide export protein
MRAPSPVGDASRQATQAEFPTSIALRGSRRERATLAPALREAGERSPRALAVWSASRHRRGALLEANALGIPALLLTPGLLRAPPGWGKTPPLLSLTADAIAGPRSPADDISPDRLLLSRDWENAALFDRAAAARRALVTSRVGGEWWNAGQLPRGDELAFVAANEPQLSGAAGILEKMLAAALSEFPSKKIVLLASAESSPRALLAAAATRGCTIVDRPVDPWAVIERAQCVYASGGEIGWLAVIAGRAVRCFGPSFYAGWGATGDDANVPQKPFRRTVDQIFAGACLIATRCFEPYRRIPAAFEDVLALLAEWRQIETSNRNVAVCLGMSWWKRRWIADFFRSAAGPPRSRRTARSALAASAARPGSAIAVWASRIPAGLAVSAARQGTPLITVEDGFVRSVGLGSDFIPAASLALDSSGTHCDPDVCSDLERLLRETEFDPALLSRARELISRLVARGITKYNIDGRGLWSNRMGWQGQSFAFTSGRRRILVPGQVEDDLSVRLGGGDIRSNIDFLSRVRAANPDSVVLYKPHPDVEAGHRRGAIPLALAADLADGVIRGGSTAAILAEIDEVHALTSLTGFEALLRGCKVVVYGRPFYAGWGLTEDRITIDRGRRLSLDQLVAGALILYPRYLDPVTRLPCAPEIVVDRLADPQLWRPSPLVAARRLQGSLARQRRRLALSAAGLAARPISARLQEGDGDNLGA